VFQHRVGSERLEHFLELRSITPVVVFVVVVVVVVVVDVVVVVVVGFSFGRCCG
jgi:hypothetical protein